MTCGATQAVDAALHVAEAERTELASIRTSLMKVRLLSHPPHNCARR